MSLKRNETYPGRFNNPTTAHPQGAFKNRTAPGAQDGSYLEQQWANDWDGFFGRLLTVGSITPNGNVDTALDSQYYTALIAAVKSELGTAAQRNVGTGSTQIPDMSSFTYQLTGGISVYRFPNNLCIQRGNSSTDSTGGKIITLPVAMSEFTPIITEGLVNNWTGSGGLYDFFTVYGAQGLTTTTFIAKSASYRGSDGKFVAQSTNFNWVAVGTI